MYLSIRSSHHERSWSDCGGERRTFNTLQNHGSAKVPILYYVFDLLILAGRDVMSEPLSVRGALLRSHILPRLGEPVRHCPELNASLADVIESVRAAGFEGGGGEAPRQCI